MVMFVLSSESTLQAEISELSKSIHDDLIDPAPFHVPLATNVLPSLTVLVKVPEKSTTEAIPSLTKVPFSVNVTSPVP